MLGWSVCKLEGVLSLLVGMVSLQVGRSTEFACWDGQFASWRGTEFACWGW